MVCFPNCLYLLLNAHKLSGIAQEKILSFISHHGIMSKNIHFHIIQSGPTLFHASPWVQRREWDNASITSIKSSTISDWLKRAVIDNSHISSITIVSSKTSGSGKTNYIRKEMIGLQAKSDCQVAVVNIHEKTTLATIVNALKEKFPRHSQRNLVCFTFTFMDLHDPSTAKSFYLGVGRWDIFVELQSPRKLNCECLLSPTEWLRLKIPVLFYSAKFIEPSKSCGPFRLGRSSYAVLILLSKANAPLGNK
jgi:hypothetical protein